MLESTKDIITNSLSNLTRMVNEIDVRTKNTDINLAKLRHDFTSLDGRVAKLEKRLDSVENRLNLLEIRVAKIEANIIDINKQLKDIKEIVKFIPKLYENVDMIMRLLLKKEDERALINNRMYRIEKHLGFAK